MCLRKIATLKSIILQTLPLSHTLQTETYVPTKNHACIPLLSLEEAGRKKRGRHMLSQHTTIEPDKKYTNRQTSDAPRNARHTAKERYGTRKVSGEQHRTWPETIRIPVNRRSCRGENFLWHAGEAASLQFHSAAMSPSPFPCSTPPLSLSLAACSCAYDHTQAAHQIPTHAHAPPQCHAKIQRKRV